MSREVKAWKASEGEKADRLIAKHADAKTLGEHEIAVEELTAAYERIDEDCIYPARGLGRTPDPDAKATFKKLTDAQGRHHVAAADLRDAANPEATSAALPESKGYC